MTTTDTQGVETGAIEKTAADAADRAFYGVTKGVDLGARTADGVASTIQLDRDGEIILPAAVKARLGKFTGGHRPMLSQHTHRTSNAAAAQAGWVKAIGVEKFDVPCTFRFGRSAAGEDWWALASDPDGFGIAFSVGFIPIRWAQGSVKDLVKAFPEIREAVAAAGLADDDWLRVWTEIELLEVSCVGVPSNAGCVQRAAEVLGRRRSGAGEIVKTLVGQAADRDELVSEISADVMTRLAEFDLAGKVAAAVKAAGAAGPAGELLEAKPDERIDQVLDRLSEVVELLCLHPEIERGDATPAGTDAPPPAAGADAPGSGEGAKALKAAARRLRAAVT